MSKTSRPSTILAKAQSELSDGWCKGSFYEWSDGDKAYSAVVPDRFCAVGAVQDVVNPWDSKTRRYPTQTQRQSDLINSAVDFLDQAVLEVAATGRPSKMREIARRSAYGPWDPSFFEGDEPAASVIDFNDDDSTKKIQVRRIFDRAIELARKAEQRERQRRSRAARRQEVSA